MCCCSAFAPDNNLENIYPARSLGQIGDLFVLHWIPSSDTLSERFSLRIYLKHMNNHQEQYMSWRKTECHVYILGWINNFISICCRVHLLKVLILVPSSSLSTSPIFSPKCCKPPKGGPKEGWWEDAPHTGGPWHQLIVVLQGPQDVGVAWGVFRPHHRACLQCVVYKRNRNQN